MKGICVEIDGVFYDSIIYAMRELHSTWETIKGKCLSDDWVDYKIVPFRVTYTEKECNVCGVMKLLKEFNKKNQAKDGFQPLCRECQKKYKKEWDKNNPDYMDKWFAKIPGGQKAYHKEHNSQPEVKAKNKKRLKEKRKNNPAYRLSVDMATVIRRSLKGKKNGAHWEDIVGWTVKEGRAHLESLFTEGMTWENYGYGKRKWNIDHVIAKYHFNITSNTCQEFKDCWALDNLQPLWQIQNRAKGNKPMHPKYLIKPF